MMRLRTYAYFVAASFGVMWAMLIILKMTICEVHDEWKKLPGAQCVLGEAVAAVELVSEFSSLPLHSMPLLILP